jgi:hypothetical protein
MTLMAMGGIIPAHAHSITYESEGQGPSYTTNGPTHGRTTPMLSLRFGGAGCCGREKASCQQPAAGDGMTESPQAWLRQPIGALPPARWPHDGRPCLGYVDAESAVAACVGG